MNTTSEFVQPGALYVVATPIGNLSDLSPRAREILKHCDCVACEDTRVTGKLLKHIESDVPMLSYRDENEIKQVPSLIEKLRNGESVAVVCDAGTPTISDPGFRIVRECRREGVPVFPVPGPVAYVTALSGSGLPTNGFLYVGFLPNKSAARKTFFEKYRDFGYSIVLYESCHRIQKCVTDALTVLGPDRVVCVARELTKLHETFIVGRLEDVTPQLIGRNLKGEFVVIIAPEDFEL